MVQLSIHRRSITRIIAVIVFLVGSASIYAQEQDSLALPFATIIESPEDSVNTSNDFSAQIGFGVGNFTFLGDVGNNFAKHNPLVSNIGYQLHITSPVSSNMDVYFHSLFGKLTVNERSSQRNLNFQTEIRGGGIGLSYNFNALLGQNRSIYPFINIGISSFEFLSKTDLLDRNGNTYHYWSDGSIRDIAQNDSNADEAEIITQDYVYESDLRELNMDDFGDYKERTFSYPIGIGVQMPLSDKINFRIGTTMYYNQTDLIDNITNESIGERKGDAKNDRFLYTNFSLSYNISIKGKTKEDILSEDLLANINDADTEDEDNDGVFDIVDRCPHTPEYAKVDEYGCPLDIDKDFIPNYRDREIETPSSMEVDTLGIGLSPEYFQRVFDNYQNMWGEPNIVKGIVESGDRPMTFTQLAEKNTKALEEKAREQRENRDVSIHNRKGEFSVLLGSTKGGITKEQSMLLLSVPDLVTTNIGDSTIYTTKSYDKLENAVLRQMSLFLDNVSGQVVEMRGDRVISLNNETNNVQNDILHVPERINKNSRGITYRIQLGAFRSEEPVTLFDYLDDVSHLKGDDGLTRYVSGSFTDPLKAAKHKIELLTQGYKGVFLTAYKDGKRIDLQDVGVEVINKIDYNKIWNEVNTEAFDKDLFEFRVQLSVFDNGKVPPRMVNKFINLGDVESMRIRNKVYYTVGHYKSAEEAKLALEDLVKKGFIAAEVIGEYEGKVLSKEEVQMMLKR